MDIQQNLELFRELMLCDGNIYSWSYDADGKLLFSNCPDQAVLAVAFEAFGCLKKMMQLGAERNSPTFLTGDTGLVWGAAFEKEENILHRFHVIGPVFYANTSAESIYRGFRSMNLAAYSDAWLRSFYEAIYRIPSSQYTIFSRDLRMLHYCVTGQRIEISDVYMDDIQMLPSSAHRTPSDRHRVYIAEKAMLEMVKRGDLNYKEALSTSMNISDGVKINTKDPMRHARVSTIVFCSIVCRAAIEGGLSPEEAYSLGDAYIQSAMDAHTIQETSTVCASMYDDFVRRVHRRKEKPHYSEPIQRCCDYVEMNIDRNIHAQELADLVGYSVTYFTRRFREETGMGISDFVKAARIERAKTLLKNPEYSIQEISDKLGFTTRNYFTRCFREITGETPIEYRNTR